MVICVGGIKLLPGNVYEVLNPGYEKIVEFLAPGQFLWCPGWRHDKDVTLEGGPFYAAAQVAGIAAIFTSVSSGNI